MERQGVGEVVVLVEMGWFYVVMTIGVLAWGMMEGMLMLVMIVFGGMYCEREYL